MMSSMQLPCPAGSSYLYGMLTEFRGRSSENIDSGMSRQSGYVKEIDLAKPGGISLLVQGNAEIGRTNFSMSIKGAL